ncbi:aspartate dehydrogenase [Sphingomonas laterariae]|uniref:L-aspartate dehydrogenase n=1 Tax=Edaphosphingomonas laterariae TaxID=861865 RepID=A0A239CXG2_9SPHN|nr:aspartate dehydrogenase [Sphingomonas laterariae]SNS24331.1 aspartate dehydrogenase [Sphingomonas laterariae]
MAQTVGIAGFGTIGTAVATRIARDLPGLELLAISAGRRDVAETRLRSLDLTVPVVSAGELAASCDIIVECAPTAAFLSIAEPALAAGRTLITVSGAAILEHPGIVDVARAGGGQIILATGALLGLDAVRAAAEGVIHSVRMVTRKPPRSLRTAKYVVENGIDLDSLAEPLLLFRGSAREGARAFPSNVNVAAALGLAGIGADRTELEIWADPTKLRNCHRIDVDADSARFGFEIENIPTDENPGTGRITALSMIAALRAIRAPLRVGT